MAKPLSRPNEIGRAIGYNVNIDLILESLERTPMRQFSYLKSNRAFLDQVGRAAKRQSDNENQTQARRLWIVVKIERGVPVMIDAYSDKRSAKRRENFLRLHMRQGFDQVGIFEIK